MWIWIPMRKWLTSGSLAITTKLVLFGVKFCPGHAFVDSFYCQPWIMFCHPSKKSINVLSRKWESLAPKEWEYILHTRVGILQPALASVFKFLSRRRCTIESISHSSKDSWNDFEAHSLTVSFVVLVILDSAVVVVTVGSVHQKHGQEGDVEVWNCLQHIVPN